MPKGKRVTDEQSRQIKKMNSQNKFYSEIATETGLSRYTIRRHLNRK